MGIFLNNFYFIFLNSFLAAIPILFGWLMLKPYPKLIRIFYGFIWLIFLPNTIYILTDLSHLFEQWSWVNNLFKFILIIQYTTFSIFGVLSFVVSTYFFQRLLDGKSTGWKIEKIKPLAIVSIVILNFLVGLAVVMGGIQRTNSWYILTDPSRVFRDTLDVIRSGELLMLALGAGILANLIYFLMLESTITWGGKLFKK